jgi:hypothetical protein
MGIITMTKISFKVGDIVRTIIPKGHQFDKWRGLQFEIKAIQIIPNKNSISINGSITQSPDYVKIDPKYAVGYYIRWNRPDLLELASSPKPDKSERYLSPFTGKWI